MKNIEVYVSENEQQVCIVNKKVVKVIDCNDADITRDEYFNPVLEHVGVQINIINFLTAAQVKQAKKFGAELSEVE